MNLEKAKNRRKKEQMNLLEIAKVYAGEMRSVFKHCTVILYGSVARGDFGKASDIDILVIADSLPKDVSSRLELLYAPAKHGIEPKGYTVSEFSRLRDRPAFRLMLKNKIVLEDGAGIFC